MSLSRRKVHAEKGFTLLEIIISLAVLAIILVPLTMSFMASLNRTNEVGNRVAATADAQRIAAAWTKDVQNVDPAGVRQGEAGCLPPAGTPSETEQPLVTFEWDTQVSTGTVTSTPGSPTTAIQVLPKKATWSVVGTGSKMRIMRRYCEGDVSATGADGTLPSMMIADSFWVAGKSALQLVYGQTPSSTDFCTGTACTINVNGAFRYSLTIGRRVPGVTPSQSQVPSVPVITGTVPGNATLSVAWLPSTVPVGAPPVDKYHIVITRSFNGTEVGSQDLGASSLAALFTGLTNGLDYYFQAQACNLNGCSVLSEPFGPVQPAATIPGAPTGVTAQRSGNGAFAVSWVAPSDDGGSAITKYRIRARVVDTGEVTQIADTAGAGLTGNITGLEPDTEYVVTVAAINAVGEGPESEQTAPLVACAVPGAAPQAPRVSPALSQAIKVDWDLPVENGCPITTYRVQSDPAPDNVDGQVGYDNTNGWNSNSTNLTYTTPRLSVTAHRFRVAAVNEIGIGDWSDWSVLTTSNATPIQPQDFDWTPTPPLTSGGNLTYNYSFGGVMLTWTSVPDLAAFNGGRPIIGYHTCVTPSIPTVSCPDDVSGQNGHQYEVGGGGATVGGATQTTGTFPNESYKTYHAWVAAYTSAGDGDKAELDFIPGGRPIASPTITRAYAVGVGIVNLDYTVPDWSKPQNNGGFPLTTTGGTRIFGIPGYGNSEGYPIDNITGGTTSLGLGAGASYTLKMAAHNQVGNSIPTQSVTIEGPSVITAPSTTPTLTRPNTVGANELLLTFTPFTYSSSNPTPEYSATCTSPGQTTQTFTGLLPGSTTLSRPPSPGNTGLTNGQPWTCTITALATFETDTSNASNPVTRTTDYTTSGIGPATPFANSGPPASLVATGPTTGKVHLVWTAPSNNGGSAITNYQISSSPALAGLPSEVNASTFVYDSGFLQAGVQYTFSVAAKNGTGAYGTAATVTFTAPTSLPTATVQNVDWTPIATNQLKIDWDAVANTSPGNGGVTPTGYHVTVTPGPSLGAAVTYNVPYGTNTKTITGLNQTTGSGATLAYQNYTVSVTVYNTVGDGPATTLNNVKSGGIPISSPGNLSWTGYAPNGAINLNWTQDPDTAKFNGGQPIKGYVIYGIPGIPAGYGLNYSATTTALGNFTPGVQYTLRIVWNNNPSFNPNSPGGPYAPGDSVGSSITFIAPGPPKISTDTNLGCTNTPATNPCRVRLTTPGSPAGRADLSFYFDVTPGSPPITGFTAQCTATGGVTVNLPNATNPAALKNANFSNRIDGLTSGKTYTCTVTATNGPFNTGSGSFASASNTLVIP